MKEFLESQTREQLALNEEGGQRVLLIKARITVQQVRDLIRIYRDQQCVCQSCGSLQTTLSKGDSARDWVLTCESCKSHRHVNK